MKYLPMIVVVIIISAISYFGYLFSLFYKRDYCMDLATEYQKEGIRVYGTYKDEYRKDLLFHVSDSFAAEANRIDSLIPKFIKQP